MKKIIVLLVVFLTLNGCETGVKNKSSGADEPVLSGIVDRTNTQMVREPSIVEKSKTLNQGSSNKIFSKTAQPGYYLQFAFFAKNTPSEAFFVPIQKSGYGYIVLEKHNGKHVLIGPYKSYNAAKSHVPKIKASLKKQTFVVNVLRP